MAPFNGGGETRIHPFSGQHEVAIRRTGSRTPGELFRSRQKRGAPFLDHTGLRHGGSGPAQGGGDLGPDPLGDGGIRLLDQRQGGTHRDGGDVVAYEEPLGRRPDHAEKRNFQKRQSPALDTKMQVDDWGKQVGSDDLGQQLANVPGCDGEDDGIPGGDRFEPTRRQEAADPAAIALKASHPDSEPHLDAVLIEPLESRPDQRVGKALAGDQRRRAGGALRQRLADHRHQQACGRDIRGSVQHRDGEWFPKAPVEGTLGPEELSDRPVAGIEQLQALQIFAERCATHAAVLVEDPPRDRSVIYVDGPPLTGVEIEKWEYGTRRPGQPIAGADAIEIVKGGIISRQHEMIAVVDLGLKQRIMPGAAAPTRLGRGLMNHDREPARGEFDSGGKAGDTGPDDVNRLHRGSEQPVTQGYGKHFRLANQPF